MSPAKPFALLAALVLTACSAPMPSQPLGPPFDGSTWSLVRFSDGTAPVGESAPSVRFTASGDVNGTTGCNGYFGTYSREGAALAVSPLGSTKRACAPPLMEQESRFMDALPRANRWTLQNGRLTLTTASGERLEFRNAASVESAGERVTLTGEVTYRPRIALPRDAVVTVRLDDVSLADAPAKTLATHTIRPGGRQVPIPFALTYDPAVLDARHTYAVRADVRDASGALLWTTDTTIPVITRGAPTDAVEIVLVQASGANGQLGMGGAIERTSWRLLRIHTPDGGSVSPEAGKAYTLQFGADGRFSGRADCNSYGGGYTAEASGALALRQDATTLAACLPPSSADLFLGTLMDAATYRATPEDLWISAGDGRALAFEPANVRSDLGTMAPQQTGRTTVYVCEGASGEAFSITARTGPGELAVWLPERFGSSYLVLGQARAASGAKYEGDGVVVWTKGATEALVEIDGETFTGCAATG